jgi:predicted dehydrogenase
MATGNTTSSTPLRVGVIGLGWAGQQHLKAYRNVDGVELVALAGMEEDLLAELAGEYGITHAVRTWEELLEVDGLDAVSIAVPTFLHAPIAVAALQRGLHVLSEKPIARNGDEGQQMVDAARAAGRVLDVAFNHRRRGDIQTLKGILERGDLGRPYYAKASWVRRSGIPKLGSWFTNKEMSGGGPLADIGVHVLDYALHLLGEPKVLSVSAVTYAELGPRGRGGNDRYTALSTSFAYEVEDFASAFIRLEGGATLVLEAGWASYRDEADLMDFSVFGTEGGADLRAVGASETPVAELRIFTEKDGSNADYSPPALPGRAHQGVIDDFISAVRGGPDTWRHHDGALALGRARIIDACYRSAAEHREVQFEEVLEK